MSDGTTGGAVPGAAEVAAMRARYREVLALWFERDPLFVPSVVTPFYEAVRDIAALLAHTAALTAALAEAERARAAGEAVDAWAAARAAYLDSAGLPWEEVRRRAEAQHRGYEAVVALGDARRVATTTGEGAGDGD